MENLEMRVAKTLWLGLMIGLLASTGMSVIAHAQQDDAACKDLGAILQNPKQLNRLKGAKYDDGGLTPDYFSKRGFWGFASCKIGSGLAGGEWDLSFRCVEIVLAATDEKMKSFFESKATSLRACMKKLNWKELPKDQCSFQPYCMEFYDTLDRAEEKNAIVLILEPDLASEASGSGKRHNLSFQASFAPTYQGRRR